ncbi:MAG: hypothetical protein A2V87_11215 [Deltaproteobacteria bacterium RBG_16_58_17]|nr:MAG: hypothetical protein A2V87_11215 [Deltaproteobacteria bacterium RBG_16_58_17]OHE17502.1 MAG: hypothetical protein A2X96_00950 [Syntrophobacterales bacterium GWC2_56_13]OHE20368.1 MAG: hypothetical protein A2X95_05385 [Syntrophobacterales bacterium GWF2_56_9]
MDLSIDAIQNQIPYYLTQRDKEALVKELKNFKSITYYINLHPAVALQGDGWSELGLIRYETGERKQVRGIVLSNSCDIDPTNKMDIPAKLLFAPIIKLKAYAGLLEKANIPREKIFGKFNSIREQRVTTLFYLPKGAGLEDEYIALLDDIHSLPLTAFFEQKNRTKLFTLSLAGFYLFVLKLSVHFCRFSEEGVIRTEAI